MKDNPEMSQEIETALRDKLLKPAAQKEAEAEVEEQDEAEAPEA